MELIIAVAGIMLVWKFSSAINGFAIGARAKSEVMAEKVISECVRERTENFEEHIKAMENKTTYSHAEIMNHFKVNM